MNLVLMFVLMVSETIQIQRHEKKYCRLVMFLGEVCITLTVVDN